MGSCATCTSGTTCETCANNAFTYNSGNKLCECPAKKYVDNDACSGTNSPSKFPLDCMATCATCTSGTTCATCVNSQFTLNTANNLCECPAKKYVSGTDCLGNLSLPYLLDCMDTCATCTDASTCATCPTDFELDSTTNTCKCVATKYLTGSTCSCKPFVLRPVSLPRKLWNLH